MDGLPLILVNMHALIHKWMSEAPELETEQHDTGCRFVGWTVYISVLPVQQLSKTCQFTWYWCRNSLDQCCVDFEMTVLAWGTNGSRTWTDFLNVFLKQETRLCLDAESNVPTPLLRERCWTTFPQRDGKNHTPLTCLVMLPRCIHPF